MKTQTTEKKKAAATVTPKPKPGTERLSFEVPTKIAELIRLVAQGDTEGWLMSAMLGDLVLDVEILESEVKVLAGENPRE